VTILRNALGVGVATLASRLLGFLRDGLIAMVLGAGPVADAFVVAMRLPNLFRRLFAEGAFAAAFVPTYMAERGERGEEAARRFAGTAFLALLAVVALLTALVWSETAAVVRLVAPGWRADPVKAALAADFVRLTFGYLAGITVVAFFAGLLAADRRFLAAALAPVLLNLVFVAVLLGLVAAAPVAAERAGRILAFAYAAAGLLQAAAVFAVAARAGAVPRFGRPAASPALARFARALGPGLLAGGFAEINVVVATMIASVDPGAVSWLYYADRLYQLPLGLVGIAVGQVLLPEIAATARDPATAHAVQNRAFEFALALTLPAAIGLALLADPIVAVLFRRGAFVASDAAACAAALAIVAPGLPAAVAIRVFSAAHFGRGDTGAPMRFGLVAIAVSIALALALRPLLGWIAVAVAGTAAAWINAALLGANLHRRGDWRLDAAARRRLPRIALAAAVMAIVVVALDRAGLGAFAVSEAGVGARAFALAVPIAVGIAVHGGLLVAFGVVAPAEIGRLRRVAEARRDEPACGTPSDRA
jgi:putative peptidoglycan lipid II flippase